MDNNKSLLKQFLIIGSGTALNMVIGFIGIPIITRIVSPTEYGQYAMFVLYAVVARMFICLGMDQALVRFYYEEDAIEYRSWLLKNCIKLPLVIAVFSCGFVFLLYYYNIIKLKIELAILILLFFQIFFEVIFRFSQLVLRLEHYVKLFSTLQVMQKALYLGLSLIFCFLLKDNYVFILCFNTLLAIFICTSYSIIKNRAVWNFMDGNDEEYTRKLPVKTILAYSLPYIFSSGIQSLFTSSSNLFLNHYWTFKEVGVFASAVTLSHVFTVIQHAFNSLWAPTAVEHYLKAPDDKQFHQRTNQIITIVMFVFGLTVILGKDIFAFLLGEKFREAAFILPFIVFHPIMYTISETTVTGLVFKKKSEMQIVVAAIACGTSYLSNYFLVPLYGVRGAAFTIALAFVMFYLARTILAGHYYYVDYGISKMAILLVVFTAYAFYNSYHTFDAYIVLGYLACLLVIFVLYKDTIMWCKGYGLEGIKKLKNLKSKNKNND